MSDDDDVVEPGDLDVGDHRLHPVGDGKRPQVAGLTSPPRQIDGEHREFWCLPVDFVDREVPAVSSVHAAVDKHERRQRHDYSLDRRTAS
jgi:hypothetical protein